jgi:hypothetical protein
MSGEVGRLFQRFVVHNGKIGKLEKAGILAPPLAAWTSGRDLRPIEKKTFRERWHSELKRHD